MMLDAWRHSHCHGLESTRSPPKRAPAPSRRRSSIGKPPSEHARFSQTAKRMHVPRVLFRGGGSDGTHPSERHVETTVRFLNVDVELYGAFDRAALLKGFGDAIDVLHDGERERGEPVVSFELSSANPTLHGVISEVVALVRALPDDARSAWDFAARRVFSIGIQAGLAPHATEWTLRAEIMAALATIEADVTLTVYGAEVGLRDGTSGS
jgi:hypothetical protein